jgi:hypothetical protein
MPAATSSGIFAAMQQPTAGAPVTETLSVLSSPTCGSAPDAARVQELLASIRRLAVDQPLLELRLGELSSLLDEMLGC